VGKGFGEEICRLAQAESILQQCLAMITKLNLSQHLTDISNQLMSAVVAAKTTAEHENRVVYMDAVPAYGSLQPIVGILMVKALPLQESKDAATLANAFKSILPLRVKQSYDLLVDRVQSIRSKANAEAMNATNEGRVILSSVGLPG